MKKYILGAALTVLSVNAAEATSTLERNLVECTISSQNTFEEIVLKFVTLEDGGLNTYEDYVLDYTQGDITGTETDILGAHEQVRQRLFTSSNAEGDGVLGYGTGDYKMIAQYDYSELEILLTYQGINQHGFKTYSMSLDGRGDVFNLVNERYKDVLDRSEHYNRYDDPLCVTHFDLDDYVTQELN